MSNTVYGSSVATIHVPVKYKNIHTLLTLLFMLASDIYAQNISEFYIVDGYSKPLLDEDNGVLFRYRTESLGNITIVFRRRDAGSISLLHVVEEYGGLGNIRISPPTLVKLINCEMNASESYYLNLSHLDFYSNYLSKKEIPLIVKTLAPYGCFLSDPPSQPELLSTELKKKKIGFSSAIGMLAGGAMVINGLGNREKYSVNGSNSDETKFNEADGNIYVGALIFVYSYIALRNFVPDDQQNKLNRRKNEVMLRNWKIEVGRVKKKNQQIKLTYTILIK